MILGSSAPLEFPPFSRPKEPRHRPSQTGSIKRNQPAFFERATSPSLPDWKYEDLTENRLTFRTLGTHTSD